MSETPRQRASAAYAAWVRGSVAPIANGHGLAGRGPTFRRRDGDTWLVFALERRRIDPVEAAAFADDARIPFRIHLGIATKALRHPWQPATSGPPGMHDIALHAPTAALEPDPGEFWHIFDADDAEGQGRLTELIATRLGGALDSLGDSGLQSLLERRLAFSGPLENLSPGAAEELLALADAAADPATRARIETALQQERVPERGAPSPDEVVRVLEEAFPEATVVAGSIPEEGSLFPAFRPRRRTAKRRLQLLADLGSSKTYKRRQAVAALAGWDGEPEIVEALRKALHHEDGSTRMIAAQSLGHLADPAIETWRRVLSMAEDADAGPRELGQAIYQLSQVDPAPRAPEARTTLQSMAKRYPAWGRELRAFAARVPDLVGDGAD